LLDIFNELLMFSALLDYNWTTETLYNVARCGHWWSL